jgi:hypothetical protein
MLNASALLLYPHPHRVKIYFIEGKVTSHHTFFGHLYVQYLSLLCMVAAATKSKGVKIHSIFAELFFLQKCMLFHTLWYIFGFRFYTGISIYIFFLTERWNLQIYLPPTVRCKPKTGLSVEDNKLPWSL